MTSEQYDAFLRDPVKFLNHPQGNVKQIRIALSGSDTKIEGVQKVVQYNTGNVHYLSETHCPKTVHLTYEDNEFEALSALWVRSSANGKSHHSKAYYLDWGPNMAYAMKLPFNAKFFLTAELTGCGIIILTGPNETIIVHHNIQVTSSPSSTLWERMFDRDETRSKKVDLHSADIKEEKLFLLAQDIIESSPSITRGKLLNVKHYGTKARVFGINSSGRKWKFFINYNNDGRNYRTEALFE